MIQKPKLKSGAPASSVTDYEPNFISTSSVLYPFYFLSGLLKSYPSEFRVVPHRSF